MIQWLWEKDGERREGGERGEGRERMGRV